MIPEHLPIMDAPPKDQSSVAPRNDDGCLGTQASAALSSSLRTYPADPPASPHTESSRSVLEHSRISSQGSEDAILPAGLSGSQHHYHIGLSGNKNEDYRRPITVTKKVHRDNEDVEVVIAVFDTGAGDINIINAKVVEDLGLKVQPLEPEQGPPRSRRSQPMDILIHWRKKSAKKLQQLLGPDGKPIENEGVVEIRWWGRDMTVHDHQALWFKPGQCITHHYVVPNATVDVLFGNSTWDKLGLRDRCPIHTITRKSQPDMSKGNLQKIKANEDKQTKARNKKSSKEAAAQMEAYQAKRAAKSSSSASNGNGA
ncbi:uncharacterized protein IWZ02DRAFT_282921 [Phyllosticta citriasiana]|uniref:uncharacterized protein n=1 Tax=Phyllosticta citriasiana TaxID=595635 RepID=UPI0030FD9E33